MTTTPPRVLLVEDDPTSRNYMAAALGALPITVDTAGTMADAIGQATRHRHCLWLMDVRLPDGSGPQLLAQLRRLGATTPALAHTADADRGVRDRLRAAGFEATIVKPVPAARLRDIVAQRLGVVFAAGTDAAEALWDDARAASALNGNATHVAALRALFVAELPATCASVLASARGGDAAGLDAQLHRLHASCGFTGASRLAVAARRLQAAPGCTQVQAAFDDAVADTLAAWTRPDARSGT